MIFRGQTDEQDWTFGQGKQAYLSGTAAIIKNIQTRLQTYYTECFFNAEIGVDWFNLLGQKSPDLLILAIKKEISNCYGVTLVTDVRYTVDKDRNITIYYTVDTIYSSGATGVAII